MALPIGKCVHSSTGRLRIRFSAWRGDSTFFERLKTTLQEAYPQTEFVVNPATASLLCLGPDADDGLAATAESKGLFQVQAPSRQVPVAQGVREAFHQANQSMRHSTREELDITTIIFVVLVGTGVWQLARGNFVLPPWYTAFWYALGVFSKSLADESGNTPDRGVVIV